VIMSVHAALIGFPRRCTLLSGIVFGRLRLGPTGFPGGTLPKHAGCRKPLSSEATRTLPGAEGETTTGRRFHPMDNGRPEPNVPVARCAGEREAGYAHPMAAQGSVASFGTERESAEKTSFLEALDGHFEEFVDEPILSKEAVPLSQRTWSFRIMFIAS
jgi:hypothetical protein